jgi:site-specific recombinase XerD
MDANNHDEWFLDPGPLSPWIDQFAAELSGQGHTPLTIYGYTSAARHFAMWLNGEAIPVSTIDDNVVRRFASHRCRRPGGRQWQRISPNYALRAKRFATFLQQTGVASASVQYPLPSVSPFPLLDDYQD